MTADTAAMITLALAAVQIIILPIGYFIWRNVQTIRENDLKHIDDQFKGLLEGQVRMEDKLDRHLEWHAGRS